MKEDRRLKLNCPMCSQQFITTRRDKIWCNISCSKKFRLIKESISTNYQIQKNKDNKCYYYDFDSNKFHIKSLMPKNKL